MTASATDDTILEATRLSLGYGRAESPVLSDVDLEIRAGEFWFLLGPNGSGKTTLLRAALGELEPMSGSIELHRRLAARARVGFVPQRCDLNSTLPTTVREFVSFGLVGIRTSKAEGYERLHWALRAIGLDGMSRRSYWSLSGGERQRALVARALVRRPSFLILDEPTSGLDLPARDDLLRHVHELNASQGITVLCVTHNLTATTIAGTHVALCAAGRLIAGPIERTFTSENLQATFDVPVRVERGRDRSLSVAVGQRSGA